MCSPWGKFGSPHKLCIIEHCNLYIFPFLCIMEVINCVFLLEFVCIFLFLGSLC